MVCFNPQEAAFCCEFSLVLTICRSINHHTTMLHGCPTDSKQSSGYAVSTMVWPAGTGRPALTCFKAIHHPLTRDSKTIFASDAVVSRRNQQGSHTATETLLLIFNVYSQSSYILGTH